MVDRRYFRHSDQKIFIGKSADADPIGLIDPLSLKNMRIRIRRQLDQDRHEQRFEGAS